MEENNQAIAYSEVYGILNSLDKKYKNSIPEKLYNFIEENREKSYTPTYDINIPLSKQDISKKAAAFICMLHYNYWCTSEEEKSKINKVLEHNYKKNREKYFKYEENMINKNKQVAMQNQDKNDIVSKRENSKVEKSKINALTVHKENSWTSKLLKFIKRLFKKN